jgi:integrase
MKTHKSTELVGKSGHNTATIEPIVAKNDNAQKTGRKGAAASKTSATYWQGKVERYSRVVAGERFTDADYSCRVGYKGRRERFALNTASKEEAGRKAAEIYRDVVGKGWVEALRIHKPEIEKKAAGEEVVTVGRLIAAATRLSSARPESLRFYALALRRIASGILGVDDRSKFSRHKKGWREKVEAMPLADLTPARVLAFKNAFLKAAKTPEQRNSAAISINSLLRNSKALLSKKVRPFIEAEMRLPSPLWFDGIANEKEPSMRYHSRIDPEAILADAESELATSQPEVFKALLLTLICGLRRSEADTLMWSQFDLKAGTLEIADTEHKALKSRDSAGVIGLDAALVSVLRGLNARARGVFVLEGESRAGCAYRADATFKTLIVWLKSKKVPGLRPIHTLRKEIGSVIASRDGILAASRYLRHADIGITSKIYADLKTPVVAGLGALLGRGRGADNVVAGDFGNTAKAKPTVSTKTKTKRA